MTPHTHAAGRFSAIVALTTLATATIGAVPVAHADTGPGPNGRIAYERALEYDPEDDLPYWDSDIFTSLPDGSDEINVTQTDRGNEIDPSWSPDGSRLAFSSNRDGNYDIYTVAADGTDLRQVTFTEQPEPWMFVNSYEPTWSPDGTMIAFTGYRNELFSNEVIGVSPPPLEPMVKIPPPARPKAICVPSGA
jgi:dipeptidyl aminopeptidase/acylaminoacyl peptidase